MGLTEPDRRRLKGGTLNAGNPLTAAVTLGVRDACAVSGLSRSALYRELAAGRILARKHGAKLLILADSLRAFLDDLPLATFRGATDAE